MALVKGASYKKHTPDKGSSNPRMRAKAKHSAMLERAKANRAEAKQEKTIRSKVSAAAKERKNTARKNKTGVFAVKSHAAKIADSKKATKAKGAARTKRNIAKILKDRSSRSKSSKKSTVKSKVTEAQRERVRRLAADIRERIRTGTRRTETSSTIPTSTISTSSKGRGRARLIGPYAG